MKASWAHVVLPGVLGVLVTLTVPLRHGFASITRSPAAAESNRVQSPTASMTSPRDYLAQARAAFTPENREYQRIRVALAIVSPLVSIAVGMLLLFTGLAQRMRDLANARARGRWPRMVTFFALYSLVMAVVLLPLDWYGGFALEHRFGLSTQTLGDWALDQAKALGFQIVAFAGL